MPIFNIILSWVVLGLKVLISLSAVVFVHELGHFIAARLRGVKVDKFSLGMGPKLAGIKFKELALPSSGG